MIPIIKNILVGLDLSDLDEHLIRYVSSLANQLEVEQVYFVHNIKKYQIEEVFEDKLKEIDLESIISKKLNDVVAKVYTGNAPSEVFISEDPSTESLMQYIVNKYTIDLVVLGNKNAKKGIGTINGKLLRMLKSHILTVPENASPVLKNIMVSTDFSRNSQKAITFSQTIAQSAKAHLSCVHVYKIPQQFFPYINKKDATLAVEKHTKKQFEKLFKRINQNEIEPKMLGANGEAIATRIREVATKSKTDLLFVADKGHSSMMSLLVGSVTETLFTHPLEIPLWVVK